jgi:hypothetical protein
MSIRFERLLRDAATPRNSSEKVQIPDTQAQNIAETWREARFRKQGRGRPVARRDAAGRLVFDLAE